MSEELIGLLRQRQDATPGAGMTANEIAEVLFKSTARQALAKTRERLAAEIKAGKVYASTGVRLRIDGKPTTVPVYILGAKG